MDSLDKILELLPSGVDIKVRRHGKNFTIELVDGFRKDDYGHASIAYDILQICKDHGLNMKIESVEDGFRLVLEGGKYIKF